MKIIVLSDIHGNKTALEAVIIYLKKFKAEQLIILGDIIDYGPHSNEVIKIIQGCQIPILCNLWGNHEQSITEENYKYFSSNRGKIAAKYTHSILNNNSWNFIRNSMNKKGMVEFIVEGKFCLAIHGSLQDIYWKSIMPGDDLKEYRKYDYVFSGHSHLPHYFAEYYKVDNPVTRNRKKTVFINPGSVGQPRNLCPLSQFSIWDTKTEEIIMAHVPYDIKKEQKKFTKDVDVFYKTRLEDGI